MATMIFVNLPVKDLERATTFYTQIGFEKNPQFSDENASCIVISDTIFVMLLVESYFATFTGKPTSDAAVQSEVILALSSENREGVDSLLARVLAAGGEEPKAPTEITDFMYSRTFQDPDGHLWETMYMDPSAVQ